MSNKKSKSASGDSQQVSVQLERLTCELEKHNKIARKHNRIAERQHQQSVLICEQAERQYLIEKSRMQPTFRITATEFLMCAPDFMTDPEQAGEAKFLSTLGVSIDERVLRIRLHVKGDAEYMRPSIVLNKTAEHDDERAFSMTELIWFTPVEQIDLSNAEGSISDNGSSSANGSSDLYLVYRDKTTLPVIHKYRLAQQAGSALRRWEVVHLDTVFVSSHKHLPLLNSAHGCGIFFADRE